jgi:SAM-dependent methyltransferase
MASQHILFQVLYRLGFTPWDRHPLAKSLRDLVEGNGTTRLPPATALDLGCGTGDNSIYLAEHGWQVTGVDFASKALDKARAKAAARQVPVNFVRADVTQLSSEGIGTDFALIVDHGCLHCISADDRDAYVREVTAVAALDARLLIVAFIPGASYAVPGIAPTEVERRFTPHWNVLTTGDEPGLDREGRQSAYGARLRKPASMVFQICWSRSPVRHYLFQRRQ